MIHIYINTLSYVYTMDCIYLFLRQIMSNPFSSALLGKGSRYIDYSQRFVVLIGALMFEMRCLGSDENPAPLGLQFCICKWLSVHHRSSCVFSPNGYQLTEFSILAKQRNLFRNDFLCAPYLSPTWSPLSSTFSTSSFLSEGIVFHHDSRS